MRSRKARFAVRVVVLAFGTGDRPGHGHPVSSALAEFTGGSGTETLTFACDVSDADAGAPSVVVASGGLLLHGATIRTLEGGDSESESTHTGVFHVHVPPARDGARGWTPGETVRVEVTFTGPAPGPYNQVLNRDEVVVDTTGGTPAIGLRLGAHGEDLHPTRPARTARYVSGTGTETLTFEYPVTASDGAVHVVEVTADSLALEGATIRNQRGFDADLEHQSSEWFAWRDVDVPRVKVSVRGGDRAPEGETLAFTVALAEGSILPVRVEYETANGTAKAGEDYKAWPGSLQFAPGETEKTVRVPLLADARTEDEETVRLRLVKARTSWPFSRMVDIVVDEAQGTILDGTGGGQVSRPGRAAPPLTASFAEAPDEHDGASPFTVRIAFSEGISIGFRTFRDQSLSVSGGSVTKAKRVEGRKDLWEVTVEPGSPGDVTVTLAGGRACGTAGAVCTGDGRALSATISTTVLGPVALSVADARVREASDVTLDFAVTLSRASRAPVAVAYATADGSATAGSDYTAQKGELTFAPGETVKTVSVPVLDDAHDEGEETLTLRLSAATGAVIADGVATGTIENTDHMPAAWLARFGRTVTDQVLEAVEARLTAPRVAGARATLAGQALASWDGGGKAVASVRNNASERALDPRDRGAMTALRDWMAHAGENGEWRGDVSAGRVQSRELTGRDFLTGTSFALTGGSAEAGGYAALWGRGAISRFDGREGDLTLDGEVTTGLMGADWAAERWTAGLAVGHARGTGSYREGGGCTADNNGVSGCAGEVEATLTGVWPYAGLTLTDRLSAWAAAGYGAGELRLTPSGGSPFTADLTMAMGAAGIRGEVLTPPPDGGLALALKGDARFTRTASEATKDADGVGGLESATADVWLVRTGIEGSRRFAPGGAAAGLVLTPSFELGVRLDGGDAETGFGVDLGGGLAFEAPKQGVALDLKARGLVAHEAPGFREWGASASLTWDPRPSTDRGLALTLRQSWGGSPTGGMEALLGRETLAGLAANDNGDTTASAGRLEAELGYGIAMFDGGFTGTPHLGVGLTETGRDYRLGWRLTSAQPGDPGFEIRLDATRREAANADTGHGLMLRGVIRW